MAETIILVTEGVVCPKCGKPLTGHTAVEDVGVPELGDVSICLHCCTILEYAEGMTLKVMTDDALIEWAKVDAGMFSLMMRLQRDCRKNKGKLKN